MEERGVLKLQRRFMILGYLGLFSLAFYFIITANEYPYLWSLLPSPHTSYQHPHQNYFLEVASLNLLSYIVNTSKCKIPDLSPWESGMVRFIQNKVSVSDDPGCNKINYNWSTITQNELVLDVERMEGDGFSFGPGICCYKIINRVEYPPDNYRMDADDRITYSECIEIVGERTELDEQEFIMVECHRGYLRTSYRAFHAFPNPNNPSSPSTSTQSTINFWKDKQEGRPPNIIILGIDSTSRLNFRRNMFQTLQVLQDDLGATEFMGFTKLGENTYPNIIQMLTGYSDEDIGKICYHSPETKFDLCPFIWKRLQGANYLTAHLEDYPPLSIFNYLKTGFVQQPTDFYSRPLFLAASDYGLPIPRVIRLHEMNCIGYSTNDEALLDYAWSILDKFRTVPTFLLSWSTTTSHGDLNNIQLSDKTYADFLSRLHHEGILNNSILIVMGDHGYRYGPSRETLSGFYEDKLPNFWIRLPPSLSKQFPEWQAALQLNSRRLTTPTGIYWTLNHILDTFTKTKVDPDLPDPSTGLRLPRKHKSSFLDPMAEGSDCESSGVGPQFCPCNPLERVEVDEPNLLAAAEEVTDQINSLFLTSQSHKCSSLKVERVTAGARIGGEDKDRYIVGLITTPGHFLFEADLNFYPGNGSFGQQLSIQRSNKINPAHTTCLSKTSPHYSKLELYCFCS